MSSTHLIFPRDRANECNGLWLLKNSVFLQPPKFESLELTIEANPKLIQRFKTFNNKRNKSVYDVAGAVSDQELEAMVKLATELKDSTVAWLHKFHPELLMP